MISIEKCPICKGEYFAEKITCTDHTSSKKKFRIVSCETCDFNFTSPRPVNQKLGAYYNSDMYISHTNNRKGLFNWIYQRVRDYTIWRKVSLLKSMKKSGTHLDIGCGTGEFLYACKNSGFETKGIEPAKLASKQAEQNYNLIVSKNTDLAQYHDSEFDSISMWHVLEHTTDLNETINQLHRILKLDGKLIIAVPNNKCWDAGYYKEYWAAWDVPIHLWHFSKKTIEQIFKNKEFHLLKIKPMIFDSYYVSVLSEEFRNGRKNYIKGFVIGLISNLYGIFTDRGHSSIIYVFEKKKIGI